MGGVAAALVEHAFEHLFIECLGWDRHGATTKVMWHGATVQLAAVARYCGFTVLHCSTDQTVLANRRLLREVQKRIRRSHREHIVIYSCETPRKQVWQWTTSLADGRRILHRELPFFSSDPPNRLIERIEGMTVGVQVEGRNTSPDLLHRVRAALLPDSESNRFAKYPSYAAESDRLAVAMKRGEPGAMQAFLQFHIPLARHSSLMLVRWFGMDPDDAEQTAMIGLWEAARRFDLDGGFQFSAYANYWIYKTCLTYGVEWGMPIRMPPNTFWSCYKMALVEAELIATHGEDEARQRLDQKLIEAGISREQWHGFHVARRLYCFSDIDAPWQALFGKPDESANMENDAAIGELRDEVLRSLDSLRERQAQVLKLRYGIGDREHTLQEIGNVFGITRERVRQIQADAECKLMRTLRRRGHDMRPPVAGKS